MIFPEEADFELEIVKAIDCLLIIRMKLKHFLIENVLLNFAGYRYCYCCSHTNF
jgi:hypothetical protein